MSSLHWKLIKIRENKSRMIGFRAVFTQENRMTLFLWHFWGSIAFILTFVGPFFLIFGFRKPLFLISAFVSPFFRRPMALWLVCFMVNPALRVVSLIKHYFYATTKYPINNKEKADIYLVFEYPIRVFSSYTFFFL